MDFRTALRAASALAVVAACGASANAAADSTPALDFSLGLATQRPAAATAMTLDVVYKNPSDPNGKPSPLRKSVVEAPPGAVFDGGAVPACTASDDQLMAGGESACPGGRVGTGTVSLTTGFGAPVDPFTVDAVLLNGGDGIVELFSDHRTGTRIAVGHARFTAPNTLTEMPARNPGGPPDGESSVRHLDFRFDEVRGPGGRSFLSTPPSCPPSGTWTSRIAATLADGHTYTAASTTPCTRAFRASPPAATPRAAIHVHVAPSRVRTGRRIRLRVRLAATAPRCVRAVSIRIGRARARSDVRGIAVLVAKLPRAGTYAVTATKQACLAGHAKVVARA